MWSSFRKEFLENIQKRRFWFKFFFLNSNFDAFFKPSTLKLKNFQQKKSRVGYVFIEESFDTILVWVMGRENHPWQKGLTENSLKVSGPELRILFVDALTCFCRTYGSGWRLPGSAWILPGSGTRDSTRAGVDHWEKFRIRTHKKFTYDFASLLF